MRLPISQPHTDTSRNARKGMHFCLKLGHSRATNQDDQFQCQNRCLWTPQTSMSVSSLVEAVDNPWAIRVDHGRFGLSHNTLPLFIYIYICTYAGTRRTRERKIERDIYIERGTETKTERILKETEREKAWQGAKRHGEWEREDTHIHTRAQDGERERLARRDTKGVSQRESYVFMHVCIYWSY